MIKAQIDCCLEFKISGNNCFVYAPEFYEQIATPNMSCDNMFGAWELLLSLALAHSMAIIKMISIDTDLEYSFDQDASWNTNNKIQDLGYGN